MILNIPSETFVTCINVYRVVVGSPWYIRYSGDVFFLVTIPNQELYHPGCADNHFCLYSYLYVSKKMFQARWWVVTKNLIKPVQTNVQEGGAVICYIYIYPADQTWQLKTYP